MNVSLTPELEAFIEAAVQSGRYGSASEAVREGLRLLQEREAKFQALKRDIQVGLNSGEGRVFSRQMLEDLISDEHAKLTAKHAAE
jgi:antitoxin ParD1/3/4